MEVINRRHTHTHIQKLRAAAGQFQRTNLELRSEEAEKPHVLSHLPMVLSQCLLKPPVLIQPMLASQNFLGRSSLG